MMFEQMTVREWMTTPAITVLPQTLLSVAREVMREFGVRRLIVAENDRMMGLITIGDVREASPSDATTLSIWELNHLWSKLTVEQVMTHAAITIEPDATIVDAAQMMLEHKVSGLPVIDGHNALVGVISEADIFRMLVKSRVNNSVAKIP
jgi:acetoin utilization protein AcuB